MENSFSRHGVKNLLLLTAVSTALATIGCSGGSSITGTSPVTGKVTYKGAAVGGATISFIGKGDARSATAISESDGSYKLRTLEAEGAMPGEYTVTVTKTEKPAGADTPISMEEAEKKNALPPPKELLPAKYGDPTNTPLKFQVKDGANEINLELAD